MDIVNSIIELFLGPPTGCPHPFVKQKKNTTFKDDIVTADNVKEVTWGNDKKTVRETATNGSTVFDYEITTEQSGKLKPIPLDKYDNQIIRDRGLDAAAFRKVKPYILAPNWTNMDTAKAINMSYSFVSKLSRRVKDAHELRTGKTVI